MPLLSNTAKRRPKQSGKFSPSHSISPAASRQPSPPFRPVPTNLIPFLSLLPKSHIYITSIDTHPRDFKRQIFLVPLFTNIAILLFIAWRASRMWPFYADILLASTGYSRPVLPSELDGEILPLAWSTALQKILGRFANILFDFILLAYISQWPRAFFIGGDFGAPVEWRWSCGFRDEEIIIRRSKKGAFLDIGKAIMEREGIEARHFDNVIGDATNKEYMANKTGYAMLNRHWDLDFLAMTDAMLAVEKGDLTMGDFRGTRVLVWSEELSMWLVYETQNVKEGSETEEEEQRRKIVAFKDELTGMGKENLFFGWIELIQFESSQEGGGVGRRKKVLEKARESFEAQGVDFDAFIKRIGMDGFPGLEQFT